MKDETRKFLAVRCLHAASQVAMGIGFVAENMSGPEPFATEDSAWFCEMRKRNIASQFDLAANMNAPMVAACLYEVRLYLDALGMAGGPGE